MSIFNPICPISKQYTHLSNIRELGAANTTKRIYVAHIDYIAHNAQEIITLLDLVDREVLLLSDVSLWLYGVQYSNSFGEYDTIYAFAEDLVNIIHNIEGRYEQDV